MCKVMNKITPVPHWTGYPTFSLFPHQRTLAVSKQKQSQLCFQGSEFTDTNCLIP